MISFSPGFFKSAVCNVLQTLPQRWKSNGFLVEFYDARDEVNHIGMLIKTKISIKCTKVSYFKLVLSLQYDLWPSAPGKDYSEMAYRVSPYPNGL